MATPITPDTKDWTWVLDRACPDCGYDAGSVDVTSVADAIRHAADVWPDVLARPDATRRPRPDRWSPLEYGCHTRDVFEIYRYRLDLMLEADDPLFANWDQDETAIEKRYDVQEPAVVARQITMTGRALAGRFDTVTEDAWQRRGRRSDGASFTIDTFARYLLHDVVHHLWDVGAGR